MEDAAKSGSEVDREAKADTGSGAGAAGKPDRRNAILVGVSALAVFLVAAATTPGAPFLKYSLAAQGLADGTLPSERLIDFSPFYLWLHLALAPFFAAPSAILEGLQIGLAALCVALVYVLFSPRLGPRFALVGAAAFALDPHLLTYQRVLEPEIVLLTSLLGALVLLEKIFAAPSPSSPAGLSGWLVLGAGLLATVAVLTRPTFLPIFLLVPLYFLFLFLHHRSPRERQKGEPEPPQNRPAHIWPRFALLFALPLGLGALLLGAYLGSPLAPVMNPGTVFFEGNQPLSEGTSALYPPLVLSRLRSELTSADSAHEHYREIARVVAPGASPAEVNRLWSTRARAFLVDHPGAAWDRLKTKLRYAFHGFRWHDVPSAARYERRLGWPSLPFSLLAALALVGLALAARDWRRALPFYLLVAVQMAVMLVFYISARQRLVMLPALVFFALLAIRVGLEERRRRRNAGLGTGLRSFLAVAVIGLLALSFSLPDQAMRDETYQQRGYLRAGPLMAALQGGAPLSARRGEIVAAMAAMPWWVDWMRPAYIPQEDQSLDELLAEDMWRRRDESPLFSRESADFDLAMALVRVGRSGEARPILESLVARGFRAYRGGRSPSDPRLLLARVESKDGHDSRAREWIEESLESTPADPFALAALAALDPGQESSSIARLDRYFGEPDRRWIYGRTLVSWGHAERAVEQLAPLADHLPNLRALRVYLGLALGGTGDFDAAAEQFLAANRLHVEPVIDVKASAAIAKSWAKRHPEDPEIQWQAAGLLHQFGFPSDAEALLDLAISHGPPNPDLEARVATLRHQLQDL